jgi:hypothetical protein
MSSFKRDLVADEARAGRGAVIPAHSTSAQSYLLQRVQPATGFLRPFASVALGGDGNTVSPAHKPLGPV